METLIQDLRFGIRMLFKNPVFTAVSVIALALGIGANTAIFSVVNAILLRPLPYKDPDRLVMVWENSFKTKTDRNVVSPADYLDWRAQNQVFSEMGCAVDFQSLKVNMTGFGEPQDIQIQYASPEIFSVLGTPPEIGRTFNAEEATPNGPDAVVLTHNMWVHTFNSDTAILGKQITLSSKNYTIVGVMPAGFQFGENKADLWLPFNAHPGVNYRRVTGRYMIVIGRLKPGVTIEQAQSQMTAVAKNLEQQYPQFNANWGINLVPLYNQVVGDVRPALLVLLGTVLLVLLIACANVANLLLARSAVRQKEIAVRTALGAGRARILRQLLTESLVLALAGGMAGLLLASWGIRFLVATSPKNIPRLQNVSIDPRVLFFTLGVSLLTGIVFGLAPALEHSKTNITEVLRDGGRGSTTGVRGRRIRNAFVVSEIAIALVLLICSGLMIKSFNRLQSVKSGIDPENVLTMRVSLPQSKYGSNDRITSFFAEADRRIEAVPGVKYAGAVSFLPFTNNGSATSFTIVGRPEPAPGDEPVTDVSIVEPHYFKAMSIPLLKGRELTERDTGDASRVLVINETMAATFFPDEDPIGQHLKINWNRPDGSEEIIGVVGDVRHEGLSTAAKPTIYWPSGRSPYSTMSIAVRTTGNPMASLPFIRDQIKGLDSDLPLADLKPMEDWLADSVAQPRFNAQLLGIFAGIALILAAVGIYGVMAYSVSQRTQEIGIRMALGARRGETIRLVITQAMILAIVGVAIGLAGAYALAKILSSFSGLLYDVKATDPATFILTASALLATALLASYFPARKATKVDPLVALRSE